MASFVERSRPALMAAVRLPEKLFSVLLSSRRGSLVEVGYRVLEELSVFDGGSVVVTSALSKVMIFCPTAEVLI